jgi:ABC-type dipeptide/oligopeptide/nickel transport system permease component
VRELGEEDFIRTAFGKGLSERAVAYRHAMPPAIAPVVVGNPAADLLMGRLDPRVRAQ